MISFLPIILAVLLCGLLALPLRSDRAAVIADGVAVALVGGLTGTDRKHDKLRRLEAAHVGRSYDIFAAQTVLYSICFGVVAGLVSLSVIPRLLVELTALQPRLEETAAPTVLTEISVSGFWSTVAITLVGSIIVAVVIAVVAHELRWIVLDQQAAARASQIEATLPRSVAFMYALSRSGMAFPDILRTLAENGDVYGEAASEIRVTVRDVDLFGTDIITALEKTSERTPSANMDELTENLASVLGSGLSLSSYLHAQYERYKEEAEAQQQQYLELLSTFAEVYVTVLVVGPLFLITILAVIGLVLEDTIALMRVITFVAVPLGTFGFIVYVDSMMGSLQTPRSGQSTTPQNAAQRHASGITTDGGVSERWLQQRETLGVYDQLQRALRLATQPVETVLRRPWLTLVLTVPIGLVWIVLTVELAETTLFGLINALARPVVVVSIGLCGSYAVVYEIAKRRTKRIEQSVPDFLDRFASVNDAGMSAIEGLRRVAASDLGELTPELKRTWRDVQWGADAQTALQRMDQRVRSPLITRAVTLITNAMETSGDIAPVMEIAADEARASQQLNRERKQVMVTYLIVIYIAFLVFLGIIAALSVSFIPAIEAAAQQAATGSETGNSVPGVGGIGDLGDVDVGVYESLFFHISAIQAVCSGLVAGQLGEGNIRDGVKHTGILLLLTYLTFSLI